MRTYRLFVCYFLFLVVGVTVTAFVDPAGESFAEREELTTIAANADA